MFSAPRDASNFRCCCCFSFSLKTISRDINETSETETYKLIFVFRDFRPKAYEKKSKKSILPFLNCLRLTVRLQEAILTHFDFIKKGRSKVFHGKKRSPRETKTTAERFTVDTQRAVYERQSWAL